MYKKQIKAILKVMRPTELAVKMGVSEGTISKWKDGIRNPKLISQWELEKIYKEVCK